MVLGFIVGYAGEVQEAHVRWVVEGPGQETARFARPLPPGSRVEGAEALEEGGRIVGVSDPDGLRFVVETPVSGEWVQPPFVGGAALHRVVVRGAALDFADSGLQTSMRYRAGPDVTEVARDRADGLLGRTSFGTMPIYVQHPEQLRRPFAVARVAAEGGRGAVWFVVAAFGLVLMVLGVLYRRLGRRARWEKTQVRVERIVREPLP